MTARPGKYVHEQLGLLRDSHGAASRRLEFGKSTMKSASHIRFHFFVHWAGVATGGGVTAELGRPNESGSLCFFVYRIARPTGVSAGPDRHPLHEKALRPGRPEDPSRRIVWATGYFRPAYCLTKKRVAQ